ncbi:MAG: PAS domain S-box protein [Desulfotignum sp.]|nr:PAS domain S-box protein [Desulfotignum sp.]
MSSSNENSGSSPETYGRLHKESRLAQKRLNTLLKFLPDPVFAFTLDNTVEYVNPAFERVFGWTLDEIKGKNINFIPPHLLDQAKQGMKQLFLNRTVLDFETQRYTKDGRILDIMINGAILYDEHDTPMGQVLILRDVTAEKRMAKTNQIMFKISHALHTYHKLGDLVSIITEEIQKLVTVEGAFILLADEKADELYFFSARFKDAASGSKFKKIRFPADQGVSGHVYKTNRPLLIPDISQCDFYLRRVDEETDLVAQNMLSVPIRLKDRVIGVVSVVNKLQGHFDDTDIDQLMMVASTVALPIENTRIHEELEQSYADLKILNQAKDKVINHLAHELKTPVSVVDAAMKLLTKKLAARGIHDAQMEKIVSRGRRNLARILDIQYEVEDLLQKKEFTAYHILGRLVAACKDQFVLLAETHTRDTDVLDAVQKAIEVLFGPARLENQTIFLGDYITQHLKKIAPDIAFRQCTVKTRLDKALPVQIPREILDIIITGLVRNAIEYTPDSGQIDIIVSGAKTHPELVIKDYGIGFTREKLRLIFENYFTPPVSSEYTTKNPYAFNAGGRGFDLLRIKLFSERFHFTLKIDSTRCRYIPADTDQCPGDIRRCSFCTAPDDCLHSGGTSVHLTFLENQ